jgi:hypothetical protein
MGKELCVRQAENGVIVFPRAVPGSHTENGPERVYESKDGFFKYLAETLVFSDSVPASLVKEKENEG